MTTPRAPGSGHAGRVGAAQPVLDGLALPHRAVGRAHAGGAQDLRRDRQGDRRVRAGDHDRAPGPRRRRLAALRPGHLGAAVGARRFLDARCRAHLRDRPGRRFGRRRLALQRLRRADPGISNGTPGSPKSSARGSRSGASPRRSYSRAARVHVDGEGTALVCAAFGARSQAQSGPRPRRASRRCWRTVSASPR